MTTATKTLRFPSVEWFEALARHAAADEDRLRRLGVVDLVLGVRVGDAAFRLVLSGFGCTAVEPWTGDEPVDCTISAARDDWRQLIESIRAHGHADPRHTLNSLVLAGDRFRLEGADQLAIDGFYRYNATLQALFDGAASVPTAF